jgi:preprotein translocase subunit SecF
MNIAKNLKYFFILPALLTVLSIAAIAMWGLKPGIDLAGGTLMQVTYQGAQPTVEQVQEVLKGVNVGETRVQPSGEKGYAIRVRTLTDAEHAQVGQALAKLGNVKEDEFTSVGPVIGQELLHKGLIALGLVIICMIIFIAFAFRGVSKPVASWKYGVVAIVTLAHDVLIPTGLFAFLGHYHGAEVDSLFIVGLLTILGISINDTIVVFDRIRENLAHNESSHKREEFSSVVGRSIMQTLARSINTSLTVIIVLMALWLAGPSTTKDFALTLIVGMVAGTYSSIFLASPLLVAWERWQKKA